MRKVFQELHFYFFFFGPKESKSHAPILDKTSKQNNTQTKQKQSLKICYFGLPSYDQLYELRILSMILCTFLMLPLNLGLYHLLSLKNQCPM